MEKIDIHLHLAQTEQQQGSLKISSAHQMLTKLEQMQITKGILMSTGETTGIFNCGYNEQNRAIAQQLPQYVWMCNLDFENEETIFSRLEHYKWQGAVGIGELTINQPLTHPFLRKIFDAAQSLQLPVLFHMSPEVGMGYGVVDQPQLPLLEKTLQDFPNCNFIGHSQPFWIEISKDAPTDAVQRNRWGEGPVKPGGKVPQLLKQYPNLYCDLSANSAGRAIMRDTSFGLWFLEAFSDRLLYGTDMINVDMEFPLAGWIEQQVQQGNLSKTAAEKIFYKNAQKLFEI